MCSFGTLVRALFAPHNPKFRPNTANIPEYPQNLIFLYQIFLSKIWYNIWATPPFGIKIYQNGIKKRYVVHLFGIQEIGQHRFPDSQRLKISFLYKEILDWGPLTSTLLGYEWNRMI